MKTNRFFRQTALLPILAASLLLTVAARAQQGITGRLTNAAGQPVAQAALILSAPDSTYLESAVSEDDGTFRLLSTARPYLLSVQHLAYETRTIADSRSDLGTIVLELKAQTLEEVVVRAERPIVRVQNGRLTFTPQGLTKSKILATAFDLLAETPGLKSTDGESIRLIAMDQTPTLLINGRPSTRDAAATLLYVKSLPADRVLRIEVAHTAPPEWNVKGAAVNIILKEGLSDRLTAQVQTQWDNKHANRFTQTASVMYASGKFSADLLYRLSSGHEISRTNMYVRHAVGSDTTEIRNHTDYRSHTPATHDLYLNLDYALANRHRLSVYYNARVTPNETFDDRSVSTLTGLSDQHGTLRDHLQSIAAEYTLCGWRAGAEYLYSDSRRDYTGTVAGRPIAYDRLQRIDRLHGYLRGRHALSERISLRYGADYTRTRNHSEQTGAAPVTSDEDIANAYVGTDISFAGDRANLSASLAGEGYRIRDYRRQSILPNISLSYAPTDDHALTLGWQAFHNYPAYWYRQTYRREVDGYEVNLGNPDLRVARYNIASLNYVYRSRYAFNVYYYHVRDAFFTQLYQSPDRLELINQISNTDLSHVWVLSASVPVTIGSRWFLTFAPTAFHEHYRTEHWHDLSFDVAGWAGGMNVSSQLSLLSRPRLTFTTDGYYYSGGRQGLQKSSESWGVNAGLQLALLKEESLLIALNVNDLFESATPIARTRYQSQWSDYNYTGGISRSVMLRLTYRFSRYKEKQRREADRSRIGIQ